ncbi:MAG: GHKL domain-containing protein [Lachnospiraceae bacterium]|nr:GHKL domain-containing protein [Lachnospiraceae bacterium]
MTMIINILQCLFEILSILMCLSLLYGEKFCLDKLSVGLILFDVTFCMVLAVYHPLNESLTVLVYPVIVVYCGLKYGWKWKPIFVNNILYIFIVGSLQVLYLNIYYFFLGTFLTENMIFVIACASMFLMFYMLRKKKWYVISDMIQKWNPFMNMGFIVLFSFVVLAIILYKVYNRMSIEGYLIIFLYALVICIILAIWQEFRIKRVEMDAEMKCYNTYIHAYEELIDIVRMRQHEFDNHLNSIISLQYTTDGYEALKNAQTLYIHEIQSDNRYNKLLKEGNPFFIGFLYGKFQSLSKEGIDIDYQVKVGILEGYGLPVYKLIEIANDLITNAAEALTQTEEKRLSVTALEDEEKFVMEVRNRGEVLDPEYISKCFEKGTSSKGEGRGYGLYNVRDICDRYRLELAFYNQEQQGKNWVCFQITAKKLPG